MEWQPRLLCLLILPLLTGAGCSSTDNDAPPSPGGWQIQYSNGVTLVHTGDNFSFTFPKKDGVHYVVKGFTKKKPATFSATFSIDKGLFVAADGGTPQVRLYFQRNGDNMSALGDYEFYRWWSNPHAVRLVPEIIKDGGKFILSVPLQPGNWSSVYGKFGDENPKMFQAALINMAVAGFTFGSDFGFGHGVFENTGTAKFKLISFKVE